MDLEKYIDELVAKARKAQAIFETFPQERIDEVCKAYGKVFYDNAELLAKLAVEETGMGNVESKIMKHKYASMSHFDFVKGKKSIGKIKEDPALRIVYYAKPIGVLACVTPTTNPTSTICANGIYVLKSCNAFIICPHPRAIKTTKKTMELVWDALKKVGAPDGLVQYVEQPTITASQLLMSKCDTTIATGGPAMVKAAYSSGHPSFGVGPGNVQSILDTGMEDMYTTYAQSTILNRTIDAGVQCASEQTLHLPRKECYAVLKVFENHGAYLIEEKQVIAKLKDALFKNEKMNPDMVGKSAVKISEIIGLKVPNSTVVLIAPAGGTAETELLCREKMCPVMTYLPWDKFEQGVDNMVKNLNVEGAGHSSVIFSRDQKHIDYAAETIPVVRLAVNNSNVVASGCTPFIGYNPTVSLGCGFWGNNSLSDNLTFESLRNITQVAMPIENVTDYDPEKVWA
jgi:succinate-semialdehyde dehydrogenase